MAFLEQIAVRIGLDTKEFRRGVRSVLRDAKDMRKALLDARDGFATMGSGVRQFGKAVGVTTAAVTGLAAALLGVTTAGAEAADQAGKSAEKLGLTTQEYGRLQFAAEQADISQEELTASFARFNATLVKARRGDKAALATLAKFRVRFQDANGVIRESSLRLKDQKGRAFSSMEVFRQLADQFALVPDGAEKSALAMELLGRTGFKLIPLLNEGRRGLKGLGDQADALGKTFTDQQAKIGDEFGDAVGRSKTALAGLRNQIGITFAPELTKLADLFTQSIVRNRGAVQDLALRGFMAARQALLDLFNAFRGNDAAVSQQWAITLRDNVLALRDAISGAFNEIIFPSFQTLKTFLDDIAKGLNEAFGTELTGAELAVGIFVTKAVGGFTLLLGSIQVLIPVITLLGTTLSLLVIKPLLFLVTNSAVLGFFGAIAKGATVAVTALAGFIGWPAVLAAGVVAAGVAIFAFWDEIKAGAQGVYDFVAGLFRRLASTISGALELGSRFAGGFTGERESGTIRRRTGGPVPGSGRGDRVPALLEPGEYVARRSAVERFGRPFFDAINRGSLPRFAEGGLVGRPVTVNFGGESFPMSATEDVVARLVKSSRAAGRRTPGRAPSWKR